MAVYKLFPVKDATLYSGYPTMNTGLDSIIEATTDFKIGSPIQQEGDFPQASRFLVEFDLDEIYNVLDVIASGFSTTSFLRVYSANARGLTSTTTVLITAIGQNWNMGSGEYLIDPLVVNGCSWDWRLTSGSGVWLTDPSVAGFDPTAGITGSYSGLNNQGGGAWYTASVASQSFDYYSTLDINTNVTEFITNWSSSIFTNYGFIVRQSESQEFIDDINQQTELKFFSRDTNTIYPPQLEIKWDDSIFNTGSSDTTELITTQALLSLSNNKAEYYPEEIAKLKINAIEKFPARTFLTSSGYTKNFYLPRDSSLYAIKDSKTNEYVIDFDPQHTKISADEECSFFNVYMNGLEPERYYTTLIQININGETKIFDTDLEFKVVEG